VPRLRLCLVLEGASSLAGMLLLRLLPPMQTPGRARAGTGRSASRPEAPGATNPVQDLSLAGLMRTRRQRKEPLPCLHTAFHWGPPHGPPGLAPQFRDVLTLAESTVHFVSWHCVYVLPKCSSALLCSFCTGSCREQEEARLRSAAEKAAEQDKPQGLRLRPGMAYPLPALLLRLRCQEQGRTCAAC